MPAPYLGGMRITSFEWLSSHTIAVRINSSYGASYFYQLYAGRKLIGVSGAQLARRIVGSLQPAAWPEHITVVAVDTANRRTDYGDDLPLRPYNRVRFRFTTAGWPTDSKRIELRAGTTPGGAVDATNVVGKEPFDTDRDYTIDTPPLSGSGTWNLEVVGIDDRPADGNSGTALAASQAVLAHPPDVQLVNNARLSVAIASQQVTVSFTE